MSVLVLGTFDGVHIAHRALINEAKKTGEKVIVCTFDAPFNKSELLSLKEEKNILLKEAGADEVFFQEFENICQLSPEEYINLLWERFHPTKIFTGFNHHFGKDAKGNHVTLSEMGKKLGFVPVMLPPVKEGDEVVSSTLIRSCIKDGNMDKANKLLGRNYSVSGQTVHGKSIGNTIDFPTANTAVPQNKLVPKGVFATWVKIDNRIRKGMTNVGTNPTVENDSLTVETHILGFSEDVYGKNLEIFFVKKIRDDKKFNSLDELKEQLSFDALLINAYLDTKKQ